MDHIFITRFSVRLGIMSTERRGELFSEKRLSARMALFKRITLRSMLAQDHKDFRWLILIDAELPAKYRTELEDISAKHPFIEIIVWNTDWSLGKIDWIPGVNPERRLATSRLDDDDALHRDFANMVAQVWKRRFQAEQVSFLSFPKGLLWSPQQKRAIHYNSSYIAIGLTLIVDPAKFPVNAYAFDHGRLRAIKRGQKEAEYVYRAMSTRIGRPIGRRDFSVRHALKELGTKGPAFIYTTHGNNDSAQKSYVSQLNSPRALTGRPLSLLLRKFGLRE